MIRHQFINASLATLLAFAFAGCNRALIPDAPAVANLRTEMVRGDRPAGPDGACWARDATPAVIETVTERIAEDATAERDAGLRTQTQQKIVQPREQIWFRTPCEMVLTPDVIASLQRALAARGLYPGDATGELDPATRVAIRAFQTARGLNSDRLSLAAARELGVIAADFGQTGPA